VERETTHPRNNPSILTAVLQNLPENAHKDFNAEIYVPHQYNLTDELRREDKMAVTWLLSEKV
jgi:hypothetical protein